jgi:hypothetical protein
MNRIGRRTLVLMAIWGVVGIVAISLSGCQATGPAPHRSAIEQLMSGDQENNDPQRAVPE